MIYFSNASEANLNLLYRLKYATEQQLQILTVTNDEEMLHKGTMIRLKKHGKRIRPQFNMRLINKTKIKISSKLMRISEEVDI